MINGIESVWQDTTTRQLAVVLAQITNIQAMQNILRDVMTEKEIIEISARLEAAKMLQAGSKYKDIEAATKLSSRTIARISDWLQNGSSGYAAAISTINSIHHSHIPPAHAD